MPASNIQISPLLTKASQNLRQQIQNKIPAYIEILDKNIHGRLTIPDPHDIKDAKGNYKPFSARRQIVTELSQSKLKSIEILMSRALPILQSTEHRDISPIEQMSEDDLLGRLKLILAQRPELAERLFNDNTIDATPAENPEPARAEKAVEGTEGKKDTGERQEAVQGAA